MSETTPLIKAALNLRVGVGFDVYAYRGIIIPLLCSYRGGSKSLSPTYEQAHVGLDLLTLASYTTQYPERS